LVAARRLVRLTSLTVFALAVGTTAVGATAVGATAVGTTAVGWLAALADASGLVAVTSTRSLCPVSAEVAVYVVAVAATMFVQVVQMELVPRCH
jgi:hypothetical protein